MKKRLERLLRIRTRQSALRAAAHEQARLEHERARQRLAILAKAEVPDPRTTVHTHELEARAVEVAQAQERLSWTASSVAARAAELHEAATRQERARRLTERVRDEDHRDATRAEQLQLDEFGHRGSR